MVTFWGSFWIRMIFLLVIHSGIFDPFKHLLCSRANLSWMDVNSLNENLCIPSWPEVFQFSTFLMLLWAVQGVLPSSKPCNSFSFNINYPFGLSVMSFYFHIYSVDDLYLYILQALIGRLFLNYFWMPCFVCIVLLCLGIF